LQGDAAAGIFASTSEVTRILSAIEQGDLHAAEQLLPLVYDELRQLAAAKLAQEKGGADARGDRPGPRGLPPAGRPGRDTFVQGPQPFLRRRCFDRAVASAGKNRLPAETTRHLRAEAAALLGIKEQPPEKVSPREQK